MTKISSDILYYRLLAGMIFGPTAMAFILYKFGTPNFLPTTMIVLYVLIGVLFIKSFLSIFLYKQVFIGENRLVIKTYFTGLTTEVPFNDISQFILIGTYRRIIISSIETYKIKYNLNGKKHKVLFCKYFDVSDRFMDSYIVDDK
jgi:capsular polysaccharide biosynthesis protein